MKALKQTFGTLLVLLALGAGGWHLTRGWFDPEVIIYVDNGSSAPYEVEIDGGSALSVPPNAVGTVEVDAGLRRIVVRQGGDIVLDDTREFVENLNIAKYVLNPDMTKRYLSEVVKYERRGRTTPSMVSLPADPVSQALEELRLFAPEPWVPGVYDDVLDEVPPSNVTVKSGQALIPRQRLCRVDADDYSTMSEAKEVRKQPLPQHLLRHTVSEELVSAIERVANACKWE